MCIEYARRTVAHVPPKQPLVAFLPRAASDRVTDETDPFLPFFFFRFVLFSSFFLRLFSVVHAFVVLSYVQYYCVRCSTDMTRRTLVADVKRDGVGGDTHTRNSIDETPPRRAYATKQSTPLYSCVIVFYCLFFISVIRYNNAPVFEDKRAGAAAAATAVVTGDCNPSAEHRFTHEKRFFLVSVRTDNDNDHGFIFVNVFSNIGTVLVGHNFHSFFF